jgi:hypothetical protein
MAGAEKSFQRFSQLDGTLIAGTSEHVGLPKSHTRCLEENIVARLNCPYII